MLDAAIESIKFLAEVPIRGMDYAHDGPQLPFIRASFGKDFGFERIRCS